MLHIYQKLKDRRFSVRSTFEVVVNLQDEEDPLPSVAERATDNRLSE